MITAFFNLLTQHDPYTAAHSARVSYYAALIAESMSSDIRLIRRTRDAAYLHDLGKALVPRSLLNKHGPLTSGERGTVESHVLAGYALLNQFDQFDDIAGIVLSHHEKYDGTGYPAGLSRQSIPLESRIIAVADSFDAITSDRTYHLAASTESALREINRQAGIMFDPEVVLHFADVTGAGRHRPVADTALNHPWESGTIPATV